MKEIYIVDRMKVDSELNLEFNGMSISLDNDGSENCYVSHAHSDHMCALKKNRKILASKETLALSKKEGVEKARIDGVKIELLPSGHILGATQLFLEGDGHAFIYTGDFKLQNGLTTEKAEIRECDELLIESTYGSPDFTFPSREEVYENIAKWVRENYESGNSVILGGYSIGKAQELIKLLNEYNRLAPIIHKKLEHPCEIYKRFGVKLEYILSGSEEAEEALNRNFVAVLPHHFVNLNLAKRLSEVYKNKVLCAVATGWALRFAYPTHEAFPLSDHADFPQIISYIEQSAPKNILCCFGDEERLANELRKRGYNARSMR